MANKADRFYYQNFIKATECSYNAAKYLVECLENYNSEKIEEMLVKMHTLEHTGDATRHEMSVALAKAFVTPFDREDLATMSQNIDEVTDTIEEVLQRFYIQCVDKVQEEQLLMAKEILGCCAAMKELLSELENYKKTSRFQELIISLNDMEEECDSIYLKAVRNLYMSKRDLSEIIANREIYDYLEKCADACEHVADTVAAIIIKNS